jgi:diguanylate cyclase (GGDEF)-like protein
MRSGQLLFLDDGNALGEKALPEALALHVERVTCLDDFTKALATRNYEISLVRADRAQLFGESGIGFRSAVIDAAKAAEVLTAVMVSSMDYDDCNKLIAYGFDDVLHEPQHVSQFEAQLRSFRRIAMMRRELGRRQQTLRQFLTIIGDSELDLCFSYEEPVNELSNCEIVLLDMDLAKSGATRLYPSLRAHCDVHYFDDLEQAQMHIFLGGASLTIINGAGKSEEALALIASLRASATYYNHPVLLVVQGEDGPTSEQVFLAGTSDLLHGDVSTQDVLARLQNLIRHERLREQLASQCNRAGDAIVHDNLTGFYTYGYAMAHLHHFEQAMRLHNLPLSLALISFDNLARINAEFGFAAGDAFLKQAANIVHHCVRGEDMVARISGSKLLLMFPETEMAQARVATSRIDNILRYTAMALPGAASNVQVQCSFKVVNWQAGDSMDAFLKPVKMLAAQAA